MDFDKSKVYTTANADELKIGSKCIFAHNLSSLKDSIEEGDDIQTLTKIREENYCDRFYDGSEFWNIAYLVSEPEEKKLIWTDLKVGDVITSFDGSQLTMVTAIDKTGNYTSHIRTASRWITDEDLAKWKKAEDYDND